METNVLAVGDSTRLEISFQSGHYSGSVRKSVSVQTDRNPTYVYLRIYSHVLEDGEIPFPLRVDPWPVHVELPDSATTVELDFDLFNDDAIDYQLRRIICPTSLYDFQLPADLPRNSHQTGSLTFARNGNDAFQSSVTLEIDDSIATRLTIPISTQTMSLSHDN